MENIKDRHENDFSCLSEKMSNMYLSGSPSKHDEMRQVLEKLKSCNLSSDRKEKIPVENEESWEEEEEEEGGKEEKSPSCSFINEGRRSVCFTPFKRIVVPLVCSIIMGEKVVFHEIHVTCHSVMFYFMILAESAFYTRYD